MPDKPFVYAFEEDLPLLSHIAVEHWSKTRIRIHIVGNPLKETASAARIPEYVELVRSQEIDDHCCEQVDIRSAGRACRDKMGEQFYLAILPHPYHVPALERL